MNLETSKIQGFLIYRIWYGDCLAYVGRTKQPLQDRIRGHLFGKPMHRKIDIDKVTKIEYAELDSEADMNLFEIYYILKFHPPLNVDDKAKDCLSVSLPELNWNEFSTPLWQKWQQEIASQDSHIDHLRHRREEIPQEMAIVRSMHTIGEISDDEFRNRIDTLIDELQKVREELKR